MQQRLSGVGDRLRMAAVLWVGAVRVGLWILPLGWVRRLAGAASQSWLPRRRSDPPEAHAVGHAVEAARRAVPHATCLVLALAAQVLLVRLGRPAELHLGGTRSAGGEFEAHAWVESEGEVVVGGGPSGHVRLGAVRMPQR